MPATFPEVWVDRAKHRLTTQDVAPWLEGVEELNVEVIEVGSGTASEQNIIHIPFTDFEPDLLIDNTSYPIAVQSYDDEEAIVSLRKYQTRPVSISDDKIDSASYDVVDAAQKPHVTKINKGKYAQAIHSIAPSADATKTPVIECSGDVVPVVNRKKLKYADFIAMKRKADELEWPEEDRRVVLSTDHWNDALEDQGEIGKKLNNWEAGKPAPIIQGFKVYSYIANPYYDENGNKVPFQQVPAATDRKGSIFFSVSNIVKKTGRTRQYYSAAKDNPETQTNLYALRHYFMALPVRSEYMGALY